MVYKFYLVYGLQNIGERVREREKMIVFFFVANDFFFVFCRRHNSFRFFFVCLRFVTNILMVNKKYTSLCTKYCRSIYNHFHHINQSLRSKSRGVIELLILLAKLHTDFGDTYRV